MRFVVLHVEIHLDLGLGKLSRIFALEEPGNTAPVADAVPDFLAIFHLAGDLRFLYRRTEFSEASAANGFLTDAAKEGDLFVSKSEEEELGNSFLECLCDGFRAAGGHLVIGLAGTFLMKAFFLDNAAAEIVTCVGALIPFEATILEFKKVEKFTDSIGDHIPRTEGSLSSIPGWMVWIVEDERESEEVFAWRLRHGEEFIDGHVGAMFGFAVFAVGHKGVFSGLSYCNTSYSSR